MYNEDKGEVLRHWLEHETIANCRHIHSLRVSDNNGRWYNYEQLEDQTSPYHETNLNVETVFTGSGGLTHKLRIQCAHVISAYKTATYIKGGRWGR